MEEVTLDISNIQDKRVFYSDLETFWTDILEESTKPGDQNLHIKISTPKGTATFIMRKSDLYIIGYVVGNKSLNFKYENYKKMYTKVELKKDKIVNAIETFMTETNTYNTTGELVTVIAFISEAARFIFIRGVIKRGFFPNDRSSLEKYFYNWEDTKDYFYRRPYLDPLINNYKDIRRDYSITTLNVSLKDSRDWCYRHIFAKDEREHLGDVGLLNEFTKKPRKVTAPGYDLEDVTVITSPADNTITFCLSDGKSETYSMTKIPPKDSFLMKVMCNHMLNGLQIENTIANLNNIAGLLTVAAASLSGTSIKSQITEIQFQYTKLCGAENLTVKDLYADCRTVAKDIGKVYDKLTSGREDDAIDWLRKCEKISQEMAEKTNTMANNFLKLSNLTNEAVKSTENEQAIQEAKKLEYEQKNEEYQAKLESNKVRQEQINKDLVGVNDALQKAVEEEEAARKRKHGFEIAGLVGNMVSGIVDMFTPDLGNFGLNDSSMKNIEEADNQELDDLKQQLEEATDEYNKDVDIQNEEKAKVEQLETDIENLNKQKETATEDQIAEIESSITAKTALLSTANIELSAAIMAVQEAQKKMDSLQDAINKLVASCESIKESAAIEEEKAREEKEKIYSEKMELEEERRNCLSNIAEFSEMIESTAEQAQTAETALQTLYFASSCIKDVVCALLTMANFWESVTCFCRKLNDTDLDEEIEDNMEVDMKTRIAYYYDSDFMLMMLKFLCQWGALYYTCVDFANELSSIPAKQNNLYRIEVEGKDANEIAAKFATILHKNVDVQIAEQQKTIDKLSQKEI